MNRILEHDRKIKSLEEDRYKLLCMLADLEGEMSSRLLNDLTKDVSIEGVDYSGDVV